MPKKNIVGVAGLSGALAHAFIPKDAGLYEKYGLKNMASMST